MDTFSLLVIADILFFIVVLCIVFITIILANIGFLVIHIMKEVREVTRNTLRFQIFIKNLLSKL